jgi:catechol 2,3-dioxygenase-like lactoylglutathione lyase family enzyme
VPGDGAARENGAGNLVQRNRTQAEAAGQGPAVAAATPGEAIWSLGRRAGAVYRALDVAVGYAASYPRPDRTHLGGGLPGGEGGQLMTVDTERIDAERERLRHAHMREPGRRPATTARGVHHVALLSSDVERTIRFYQDLLGFPLIELFENRDYRGSNHFFFDIGNGNTVAFFDFPDLGLGAYAEVLGGLHHLAISVTPEQWEKAKARLDAAGVEYKIESQVSMYFRDPDGVRLELIADPLGEMYGSILT